ncbi:hypothetical protein MNBD_GAMMA23-1510 [hydrothermal vent metagenome]|uniref:Outer membrane protein beta-barrel domain-containing protein n=1 Tax=hydrothermal vent metagenome TaxID=652676 RepID=A0A3B1AES9_9ZZZZ
MKLKLITLLTALFLIPNLASAELVIINGNSWDKEITGKIRDASAVVDEIDLKTDLALQDNKETFVLAYIEHPIPLLPNIRIGSTSLNTSGSATYTGTYNGVSISGTVTSTLNLDHTEVALYWNILDNVVGLDLGLNVKFFDGRVKLDSTGGGNVNEAFDETVPMLYAGLQFELPYGLQLAGDISYLSFDGSSFTDTLVRLRWTSDFLLGVELGYRSFVIDYEDTGANEYVDIDISGPYLGVHLAF